MPISRCCSTAAWVPTYKAAPGVECELANLTDPEGVKRVHAEYLAAGAQAIKTNTFGLPRMAAAQMPGWEELAEAGWKLACDAAAEKDAVGLCGPRPGSGHGGRPGQQCLRPCSRAVPRGAGGEEPAFSRRSARMWAWSEAVKALRVAAPDAFVVSLAVLPDGYTPARACCSATCCTGWRAARGGCRGPELRSGSGRDEELHAGAGRDAAALSVMPNAGYPVVTRARRAIRASPEYFAREMGQIAATPVSAFWAAAAARHLPTLQPLRAERDALPRQPERPAAKTFHRRRAGGGKRRHLSCGSWTKAKKSSPLSWTLPGWPT